jgi:hypothetical protein
MTSIDRILDQWPFNETRKVCAEIVTANRQLIEQRPATSHILQEQDVIRIYGPDLAVNSIVEIKQLAMLLISRLVEWIIPGDPCIVLVSLRFSID